MASAFTHGFVGLVVGRIFKGRRMPPRFWVASALLGILPDADAIGFKLGVPYGSLFGHRGITHSIAFAVAAGCATAPFILRAMPKEERRFLPMAAFLSAVTLTHSILDAMTTGGHGVAFFAPFDNTRYFFEGFRPIKVSPIDVASFFSARGLAVLRSEITWVWLPSLALLGIVEVARRVRSSRSSE